MADLLKQRFFQLLEDSRLSDGSLDLWQFILKGTKSSTDPSDMEKNFGHHYQVFGKMYENIMEEFPIYHQMNELEKDVFDYVADYGFPYWFATEWFFTENAECSVEHPLLCLPLEALAQIARWKQMAVGITVVFLTILAGVFTGVASSGRKVVVTPTNILRIIICLLLDVIGLLSMFVPFIGNALDLILAPIVGVLAGIVLGSSTMGFMVFLKEILIVTDVIPLCTIFALMKTMK